LLEFPSSQFANYGYHALSADNIVILILSACVFVGFEIIGGIIIHKGDKK
jgi:hypothetical protein